jgi:UDP-N-acetylglucosamine enolpyruvyl transferase
MLITVCGVRHADLGEYLNVYRRAGGEFDFSTDGNTALTQADGVSVLHETVHENRLAYGKALQALGTQMQVFTEGLGRISCRFGSRNHQHSAVMVGPTKLQGTNRHLSPGPRLRELPREADRHWG